MNQLVFVDDSGDPGFKLGTGSSSHFVIACVIFDDNLEAEATSLVIKRFRRSLGWPDGKEFKFNKLSQSIRESFLREVKDCNFRIRAIVADKSRIKNDTLRTSKHSFYNYMIKEVLAKSQGSIVGASLRLDGHEDRVYKKEATTYFRQQLGSKENIVQKLRFVDSKSDSLIQLADMIAGSILRSTQQSKTDSKLYLKLIESRVEDIWNFR